MFYYSDKTETQEIKIFEDVEDDFGHRSRRTKLEREWPNEMNAIDMFLKQTGDNTTMAADKLRMTKTLMEAVHGAPTIIKNRS